MPTASALAGAGLSPDPITDLQQLTEYPFMVNALEAGAIVAVTAGAIGWFMVLRRQTFAGHTLSLMAFPGATFALLLGLSATAGYFAFATVAALVIGVAGGAQSDQAGRGQVSAVTGSVQAFGLACGFLFLSLYRGVLANYESLLFGSFLGITRAQVLTLAIVAATANPSSSRKPLARARVGTPRARATPSSIEANRSGRPITAITPSVAAATIASVST